MAERGYSEDIPDFSTRGQQRTDTLNDDKVTCTTDDINDSPDFEKKRIGI